MNIGILANAYPQLSETFIRREVEALESRGHTVNVFTKFSPGGPLVPRVTTPVAVWEEKHIRAANPEVLYASLGFLAHERARELSQRLNLPFALRIWEGFDAFTRPMPHWYAAASADPRCLGIFVEDEWMRQHAIERMSIAPDKLHVVPNSIDLERYAPAAERPDPPVVLAVARFVKKKGLIHLVRAFKALNHPTAILRLVGYGVEEQWLRSEAGPRVEFPGAVREENLPALYQSATIFVAPCVRERNGDGDGIPTTVLEAMACGLTVIVSDLLSAPCYVTNAENGYLVPPANDNALTAALAAVLNDPTRETGTAARTYAIEHLDLHKNIARIEAVLEQGSREQRWRKGLDAIAAARAKRSTERNERYERINAEALAFLDPYGDLLDVGCGDGGMVAKLNGRVTRYRGVDPYAQPDGMTVFSDKAEALGFEGETFDTALSYSVLQHVAGPLAALQEMHRVLKPGGRLALAVNVNDPNPVFLNWWQPADVLAMVKQIGFRIESSCVLAERHLCVRAIK